jgi:hypothetical protein
MFAAEATPHGVSMGPYISIALGLVLLAAAYSGLLA